MVMMEDVRVLSHTFAKVAIYRERASIPGKLFKIFRPSRLLLYRKTILTLMLLLITNLFYVLISKENG